MTAGGPTSTRRRTARAPGARCSRAATVRRLRPTVSDTPRKSTFSIVAADLETGEVGCAVQSKYFAVGSVVPWAKAGVGAVATQAAGVAVYGPRVLERLELGQSAEEAVRGVLEPDEQRETRQLAALAVDGRAYTHT